MAFAEGGFGRGFASTYAPRQQAKAQKAMAREQMGFQQSLQTQQIDAQRQLQADELRARAQEQAAKAYRESRDKLMESSLDTFNQITTAAADAEKSGVLKDEQRAQFRDAANAALISTITTLQNDYALAVQAGADPNEPGLLEIRRQQQMLASQSPVFDARVAAAKTSEQNPTIMGQRRGMEKAAEVRQLATELGLEEDVVAEGLGYVPGQPAPTEMEKLERSLRLLDANDVPDDDPRRLRVLGRLTSMTTPSVADIIAPLIAKMARGEDLTPEEQKALDAAQKLSFTDQLLRSVLGGGAGGTPQYRLDDSGNMVPQ